MNPEICRIDSLALMATIKDVANCRGGFAGDRLCGAQ